MKIRHVITGPPLGGQTSNGRWRLSSSFVTLPVGGQQSQCSFSLFYDKRLNIKYS